MQDRFANSLRHAISESRFRPYLKTGPSNVDELAHYLWNMALCESLYPVLQCLEVTLRNSIHDSVTLAFDKPDWFESVLVEREMRHVERAKSRLESRGKAPTSDDIVAALSLGFWVNLFYRSYEQKLWPRLLVEVFPYLSPTVRMRAYVSRRLNPIRNLRNRVFHHEPIWHWNDLESHHLNVLDVIAWINPDMLSLVKPVDRFPDVYAHGLENCRRGLLSLSDTSI